MMIKLQGIIGFDAVPTGQIIGSKFKLRIPHLKILSNEKEGRDKKLVYRTAIINLILIIQCLKVKICWTWYQIFVYRQRIPLATLNEVLVIVEYQETVLK
jgi:hypothetical protein